MYRTAAKRLFLGVSSGSCSKAPVRFPNLRCLTKSVNSESFANQSSNQHQNPLAPDYSDSTSSSTSSNSSTAEEARHHQRPRVEYQEEQARVLGASVPHVVRSLNPLPAFTPFFLILCCIAIRSLTVGVLAVQRF